MTSCVPTFGCRSAEHSGRQSTVIDPKRPLCTPCLDRAARSIRSLVDDYRDLALDVGRQSSSSMQPIVSGSADLSTPIRLGVDALAREIHWTLTVWEPAVRESARLPPEKTSNVRIGWAVATAVSVIAPRVDVLAALPLTCGYADGLDAGPVERDGVYAVGQLVGLHRRARAVLGVTRLVTRLPGECSGCNAMALQREDGSDHVDCGRCRRSWTWDDYRRYVLLTLAARP